jgi:tetratricopeptide (TPR) repeat protein
MKLANQGSEAIVMHDYLGAEKYLEEALARNPDNTYALFNMGVVYENTGRQQQAISMYQKVLDLNPNEKTTQGNKASPEDQSITGRARTNLKKLQMEIASTYRPVEKSGLTMSEEPDLKDFFPSLKESETEGPASGQVEGNAIAQEPELKESSAPLQESESRSEMEKKILDPLAPPPATTEVKKVDEPMATPSPELQKTEPVGKVYSIQVASYKNLDAAVKRIAELIELGYDASYKEATIKGKGTWHRIFVDEFKSKEEARKKAQSMKDKKVISDYMIKVIE